MPPLLAAAVTACIVTILAGKPQLTEDDLQDPDLLGELGEVSGGAEFDAAAPTKTAEGETGGEYADDDDDEAVEPDRESESEVEEEDMLALGDLEEVRRSLSLLRRFFFFFGAASQVVGKVINVHRSFPPVPPAIKCPLSPSPKNTK